MDSLERDHSLIESILIEYTKIPYAYGDIQTEAIFDRTRDRYVLMNVGWDEGKRVHGSLVHIDIIDGKVRVHTLVDNCPRSIAAIEQPLMQESPEKQGWEDRREIRDARPATWRPAIPMADVISSD